MLETIIKQSITHRWLVLISVLAICALGIYNFNRLPIDAVPDIVPRQHKLDS